MGKPRFLSTALAIALTSVFSLSMVLPASAATTVTVSPANMQGWGFSPDAPSPPGSGALVVGPGAVPIGVGSAQLEVDEDDRYVFGTQAYAGTRIDALTALSYSAYRVSPAAPSVVQIALQIDIDFNATDGTSTYGGRLVYEPYFNGTVQSQVWQRWDASAPGARWWASRIQGPALCSQSNPCTMAQFLGLHPHAVVFDGTNRGAVLFKAGGPWPQGFKGNVDAFTIGVNGDETTFDFEPFKAASDKDDCKNGGWQNIRRADGTTFKNQGDCVSYTSNGR
jgi:hypothetical protein